MSKYKYFSFHDLKDLVMIYGDINSNYNWDNARIVLWNPDEQQQYEMYFTGSTRGEDDNPGTIHFNIRKVKEG